MDDFEEGLFDTVTTYSYPALPKSRLLLALPESFLEYMPTIFFSRLRVLLNFTRLPPLPSRVTYVVLL